MSKQQGFNSGMGGQYDPANYGHG